MEVEDQDTFGMLVHSCYVDNGYGDRVDILDQNGLVYKVFNVCLELLYNREPPTRKNFQIFSGNDPSRGENMRRI
jgi:hypothetical protein